MAYVIVSKTLFFSFIKQVPRERWFCKTCQANNNSEASTRSCNSCTSVEDSDKMLRCEGPGCEGRALIGQEGVVGDLAV